MKDQTLRKRRIRERIDKAFGLALMPLPAPSGKAGEVLPEGAGCRGGGQWAPAGKWPAD
ncbi:hypothetical protein [Robiginitalea sp. SC105]|uniref:hypothetical protein n=1 Tax=Robiginitalea sp. SC105 TaxID=2762332 RepID=UPI0016395EB3|nr:hypothetical protein [Robiginitalea sp. SC105]MBC2838426.1 hypothetical protein [Robiginitalea sp. SC105]